MNSRTSAFLILLGIHLSTAVPNCCPEDNVYNRRLRSCAEESLLMINCTLGRYILDPTKDPIDTYLVLDNGDLRIGDERTIAYTIPPDRYCITHMDEHENGSLHEVAIVCFPEEEEATERGMDMRIYYFVLLVISIVFFFLTLLVYLLISELRDLQGKCIISTVLSLKLAYIALAGIQLRGHTMQDVPCLFSAFFMYFWLLASFFWLNIASFNVWRTVEYQRFYLNDSQLFWVYSTYGWGSPLVFLIAAIAVHHAPETIEEMLRPNFAETKCWFHGNLETWAYFYGPISVLLGMNIIFFLMTVFRLWRLNSCESAVPGLRSSRFKCVLYLKIFLIMGILWIFEVISFVVNNSEGFWYVTDSLNSLQGVFIFFVVVCRKRVLNGLSKREWGRAFISSICPRRCLMGPDLEQEEAILAPEDDETFVAMGPPPQRQT